MVEQNCDEKQLKSLISQWQTELGPHDYIFLEGPMGAGKSTVARWILEAVGVHQTTHGSPTFAIAHEYTSSRCPEIIHIDFYRIESEAEMIDSGIAAYYWERNALMISEWLSLWKTFQNQILRSAKAQSRKIWIIELGFLDIHKNQNLRSVKIEEIKA